MHREENIKLRTKIRILENEMGKQEKALEEFLGQQVPQAQGGQREPFLVIQLKKQVKDMKQEAAKREEELEQVRKNIRNTRQQE